MVDQDTIDTLTEIVDQQDAKILMLKAFIEGIINGLEDELPRTSRCIAEQYRRWEQDA